MTPSVKFLIPFTLLALAACSSQTVKQDPQPTTTNDTDKPIVAPAAIAEPGSGQNPPMTIMKGRKKLNLVRIMDGGICKNEFQGAKGAFLLYADPKDIERIKREKGTAVFSTFQTKIEAISADVLQAAIDNTNLAEDPFALGEDEAQEKLAHALVNNFRTAAIEPVASFQKETSLTIDISAFPPSLVFYQKGCEVTDAESDS
ncbi:MAG: hypothetical protein NTV43_13170 [Methylococcales bacterium]|nr:hypothetical protein [Methylococcales bacterium]